MIFFFLFSAIAVLSALAVILFRNPVYSVLSLVLCLFAISGHYVLLNASFLAIVNIIVYAGAVMVLFLFVLMLMNLNHLSESLRSTKFKLAAASVSLVFFLVLLAIVETLRHGHLNTVASGSYDSSMIAISRTLFSTYAVPFELTAVLFLSTIVGAVLIGKKQGKDSE